jgi:hypothetical protein
MEQMIDLLSGTVALVFLIALYAVSAISLQTIGNKTGAKNTWFAWVPILNMVLLLEIAGMDLWMIILFLVPCVNWVFFGYVWSQVAAERGKSELVGWLMLVPFIDLVIPPYLAFSD